ncbi:MAG: hypothetical protein KGH64_06335 [Candidatus Micrarchaeota archaeon]|nr:hypothetical protein [Candidatus Micrarchaeota archaeon]MDE1834925.1 hypothetical protein [Candidatus Micrarchaeota archaeon]MDE1860073.1 hypothetical protein [Candidatus Micrarchaeota archaeon]
MVSKNSKKPDSKRSVAVNAKKSVKSLKSSSKAIKAKKTSGAAAAKSQSGQKIKKPAGISARKLLAQKAEEDALQARNADERRRVTELIGNNVFATNVGRSVGVGAVDILKTLSEGPKTDEIIAEKLNIKVNDVRRMLNAMNSYSIVRYDVNKDSKGWLLFTWRIDCEKLTEYVNGMGKERLVELSLPLNCNDFFVCKACYGKEEKMVLPFDSAFERGFTCNSCGKPFAQLSREETVVLFKEA